MFKKLFLVIIASIFLMTACDSVKGVNLNQMFLNNSKYEVISELCSRFT